MKTPWPFRPSLTKAFWSVALLIPVCAGAQTINVTGSVEIVRDRPRGPKANSKGVVVWLTPIPEKDVTDMPKASGLAQHRFLLLQSNKTFEPHLMVIPVGSEVDFPNKDPFFHNVFSLFDGKRFDLGLYQSGSSRTLRFDRPGVSYLFCNIHSEMSAVIITLDSPYYAVSDVAGQIMIPEVAFGHYFLHVWREGSSTSELKDLSKSIVVSRDLASLGRIVIIDHHLPLTHKNKYGKDYDPVTPPGQVYQH
jgi:plastocyanin